MAFWQWSKTAAANANADPTINFAEGQAGSTLNDSCRNSMAALAQWRDDTSGLLVTAGGPTAYTALTNQGLPATPSNGQRLVISPNVTNASAPTLACDLGTPFPIHTVPGAPVGAGLMVAGAPYGITFNLSVPAWILNDFFPSSIGPNSVSTATIQDSAVTTSKIADANVTNAKLVDNTIAISKLATDTGNKGKAIGYDPTTGAPTTLALASGVGGLLHVREQQAQNVAGGAIGGAGIYSQRPLNTVVVNEIAGATLSSNQISLPAGSYFVTGYGVVQMPSDTSARTFRVKLFNLTANANALLGTSVYGQANIFSAYNAASFLGGRITIASTSLFELRLWNGNVGAAVPVGLTGDPEVYSELFFTKTA